MYIKLITIYVMLSSMNCKMPESLTGTYQSMTFNGTSVGGNTSRLERLMLREDSTFSYYVHNDQGCYRTGHARSGTWSMIADSIQLETADTIPLKLDYIQNSSRKLIVEFFDQFGCQYMLPVPIVFKGKSDSQFTVVKYGIYNKKLPKKYELFKLSQGCTGKQELLIPVKRDSMHIQIYGLRLPHAKVIERTRLVKRGNILEGNTYAIGQHNSGYVPLKLYQERKFKYYKWEL